MTDSIEGIRLSGPPAHPQVRIKRPAAFSRPTVDLGAGVARHWRDVRAEHLAVGDTVPGLGTIWRIRAVAGQVHLDGGEDSRATYDRGEQVFAFTAAPEIQR